MRGRHRAQQGGEAKSWRALLVSEPGISFRQLARRAHTPESTASKWAKVIRSGMAEEGEGRGRGVRVAVEDHGPGLPACEQACIWQRFYRAEGINVQGGGSSSGLGLGLHICKSIVELHGGAVGIASEVGKGSVFWFWLPLAPASGATTPHTGNTGNSRGTGTDTPD